VQAYLRVKALLTASKGDQKISDRATALTKTVHVSYGDNPHLLYELRIRSESPRPGVSHSWRHSYTITCHPMSSLERRCAEYGYANVTQGRNFSATILIRYQTCTGKKQLFLLMYSSALFDPVKLLRSCRSFDTPTLWGWPGSKVQWPFSLYHLNESII
jgi:hypothetical protein